MNKTGRLIRNELIKKIKQPSTIIFIAIFLAFCFALPFLINWMNAPWEGSRYDRIQGMIEENDYMIEMFSTDEFKDIPDYAKEQYIKANEFLTKAHQLKIDSDDWRYTMLYDAYHLFRTNYELELILEDRIDIGDKEKAQYLDNYSGYIGYDKGDKDEIQEIYDENKGEIDRLWTVIEKNDYKYYCSTLIDSNNSQIEYYKNIIVGLEKEIEENPYDKELQNDLNFVKNNIEKLEFGIKLLKYRIDNEISFDGSWQDNTISNISSTMDSVHRNQERLIDIEKNSQDGMIYYSINISKQDEIKAYKKMIKTDEEFIESCWYSLDNDIPMMENTNGSRRESQNYFTLTIFAAIVSIFIASNIVSSEFSTKTINMLIIRPVKRWKIISSKYIVVLIFSYGIFFSGMIAFMLSTGLISGFSDYFIPYLFVSGGGVQKMGFFIYMLKMMFFNSTNILFLVTVVFMTSTLTKNTALSTIVGMGVYFIGTIIYSILLYGTNIPLNFIKYSILPYLNLNEFMSSNSVIENVFSATYGAWQFVILSAVMFAISLVVFNKRDVK